MVVTFPDGSSYSADVTGCNFTDGNAVCPLVNAPISRMGNPPAAQPFAKNTVTVKPRPHTYTYDLEPGDLCVIETVNHNRPRKIPAALAGKPCIVTDGHMVVCLLTGSFYDGDFACRRITSVEIQNHK
jgi:hypothetical protein